MHRMQPHIADFLVRRSISMLAQPLRVAIYTRIAEGIRAGIFSPEISLPDEIELGELLGVSRVAVREALMLLEEDGLIATRRGAGRYIVPRQPRIDLARLQPLEQFLALPDQPVTVRRLADEIQTATDFAAGALRLAHTDPIWFFENLLMRGKEKIALTQEFLPANQDLSQLSAPLAAAIAERRRACETVLNVVIEILGADVSHSRFDIGVGSVGALRGRLLGLRPGDPVLLLSQTVFLGDAPLYLAKHVIPAKTGHLSLLQNVTINPSEAVS